MIINFFKNFKKVEWMDSEPLFHKDF